MLSPPHLVPDLLFKPQYFPFSAGIWHEAKLLQVQSPKTSQLVACCGTCLC